MATNQITADRITNNKTLFEHGALHIPSRIRSHRYFRQTFWTENQPHFFIRRAAEFVDPVNPTDTRQQPLLELEDDSLVVWAETTLANFTIRHIW